MEEIKKLEDEQIEEADGGIDRPNGPIKTVCPNCRSTNTYLVRIINTRNGEKKTFHCSDCQQDFEKSSGGSGPRPIG